MIWTDFGWSDVGLKDVWTVIFPDASSTGYALFFRQSQMARQLNKFPVACTGRKGSSKQGAQEISRDSMSHGAPTVDFNQMNNTIGPRLKCVARAWQTQVGHAPAVPLKSCPCGWLPGHDLDDLAVHFRTPDHMRIANALLWMVESKAWTVLDPNSNWKYESASAPAGDYGFLWLCLAKPLAQGRN